MDFPANRFQVFLESIDGQHARIWVAHSVTHDEARDMNKYPAGIIECNGRKWVYSYSLMDEYCRELSRNR